MPASVVEKLRADMELMRKEVERLKRQNSSVGCRSLLPQMIVMSRRTTVVQASAASREIAVSRVIAR